MLLMNSQWPAAMSRTTASVGTQRWKSPGTGPPRCPGATRPRSRSGGVEGLEVLGLGGHRWSSGRHGAGCGRRIPVGGVAPPGRGATRARGHHRPGGPRHTTRGGTRAREHPAVRRRRGGRMRSRRPAARHRPRLRGLTSASRTSTHDRRRPGIGGELPFREDGAQEVAARALGRRHAHRHHRPARHRPRRGRRRGHRHPRRRAPQPRPARGHPGAARARPATSATASWSCCAARSTPASPRTSSGCSPSRARPRRRLLPRADRRGPGDGGAVHAAPDRLGPHPGGARPGRASCSARSPTPSSSSSPKRPSSPSCSPTPGATSSSPPPTSST